MYQVWPVLPAFDSELFAPYSPGAIEPSMVGVFHCAQTGAATTNATITKRANLNTERRISSSQFRGTLIGWKVPGDSRFGPNDPVLYTRRGITAHYFSLGWTIQPIYPEGATGLGESCWFCSRNATH